MKKEDSRAPVHRVRASVFTVLVALLAVTALGYTPAKRGYADTQYYGAIEGKTYRNNYVSRCPGYMGVWGSTWVTSGAYHSGLRIGLHPQYYLFGWNNEPTQVVDTFANYVSTDYFYTGGGLLSVRGWSYHADQYSGDSGTTSDGY